MVEKKQKNDEYVEETNKRVEQGSISKPAALILVQAALAVQISLFHEAWRPGSFLSTLISITSFRIITLWLESEAKRHKK